MAQQSAVPALMDVTFGGTELQINQADIPICFKNNTKLVPAMSVGGIGAQNYFLEKGTAVQYIGKINLSITPLAKSGDTDKNAKTTMENLSGEKEGTAQSEPDKDKYNKEVVIKAFNAAKNPIFTMTFSGFLSDFEQDNENVEGRAVSYKGSINISDVETINITQ